MFRNWVWILWKKELKQRRLARNKKMKENDSVKKHFCRKKFKQRRLARNKKMKENDSVKKHFYGKKIKEYLNTLIKLKQRRLARNKKMKENGFEKNKIKQNVLEKKQCISR